MSPSSLTTSEAYILYGCPLRNVKVSAVKENEAEKTKAFSETVPV